MRDRWRTAALCLVAGPLGYFQFGAVAGLVATLAALPGLGLALWISFAMVPAFAILGCGLLSWKAYMLAPAPSIRISRLALGVLIDLSGVSLGMGIFKELWDRIEKTSLIAAILTLGITVPVLSLMAYGFRGFLLRKLDR